MIGKTLRSSPSFPPSHTVHATFIAHGVPSINYYWLVTITPLSIAESINASTTTFQHKLINLLFFDWNLNGLYLSLFLNFYQKYSYLGAYFDLISTIIPAIMIIITSHNIDNQTMELVIYKYKTVHSQVRQSNDH